MPTRIAVMIKTVKLAKSTDFSVSCATQNEQGDELEFIQSAAYNICWKSSAIDSDMDLDELTFNQNVTVHKIEHFLQNYIDNSIWYEKDGTEMVNRHFSASENMLIVTPSLNFTILGLCLYAKLNTLCKPGIIVTDIVLKENDTNTVFEYSDLDGEYPESLPSQEDFMGELSIWKNPWWMRDDVTTYDNFALSQEDVDNIRVNICDAEDNITSDFEQIEDQVRDILGTNAPAEIIEIDFEKLAKDKQKWKPTLV